MLTSSLGELKKGDLSGIRVYKFEFSTKQLLLAYSYEEQTTFTVLRLESLGTRENFYRLLKAEKIGLGKDPLDITLNLKMYLGLEPASSYIKLGNESL